MKEQNSFTPKDGTPGRVEFVFTIHADGRRSRRATAYQFRDGVEVPVSPEEYSAATEIGMISALTEARVLGLATSRR